MSIRGTFLLVFGTLAALLLLQAHVARLIGDNQRHVAEAERRRYDSYQLADELRQSSDDLTRMARTYVVTGDTAFEGYFHDILAIRNGERARPADYGGIYWDLVIAHRQQAGSGGQAVALETRMKEMGFTADELKKLEEARDNSDALVTLEERAMNAVKGRFDDGSGRFAIEKEPDLELARQIMHGVEYHEAKAEIMKPIDEFFGLLDARTNAEVDLLRRKGERLSRTLLFSSLITVAIAMLFYAYLELRVVRGILTVITRLKDIAEGQGDLTRRVDQSRRDELGTLGKWFNAFVQQVHDIVRRVTSTSVEVASAADQIATNTLAQRKVIETYRGSTQQSATAVQEISATSRELAKDVTELAAIARQVAEKALSGREQLAKLDSLARDLSASNRTICSQLDIIKQRADKIGPIVKTIAKVADRTNILSINAGLEAEKAGEHGRGFAVVATEVRRLADETAAATLGIERLVHDMLQSVAAGVEEVANYSQPVRHAVGAAEMIGTQLGEIITDVAQLSRSFEHTTEGIAAQSEGAAQIRDSVVQIDCGAGRIADSLEELVLVSTRLEQVVHSLQQQIESFTVDSPVTAQS